MVLIARAPLDQPLAVVSPIELPEGLDELGDGSDVPHPAQVLLQSGVVARMDFSGQVNFGIL